MNQSLTYRTESPAFVFQSAVRRGYREDSLSVPRETVGARSLLGRRRAALFLHEFCAKSFGINKHFLKTKHLIGGGLKELYGTGVSRPSKRASPSVGGQVVPGSHTYTCVVHGPRVIKMRLQEVVTFEEATPMMTIRTWVISQAAHRLFAWLFTGSIIPVRGIVSRRLLVTCCAPAGCVRSMGTLQAY